MTTLMAVLMLITVVLGLVVGLVSAGRRRRGPTWSPAMPLGADPERDRDLGRAGADLAAIAAHRLDIRPSSPAPAPSSATPTVDHPRPSRQLKSSGTRTVPDGSVTLAS